MADGTSSGDHDNAPGRMPLSAAIAGLGLLVAQTASMPAHGQSSLDDQLGAAMTGGCGPDIVADPGSDLERLCGGISGRPVVTTGGDETTAQGSAVSVLPRAVAVRLEGPRGIVAGGASADQTVGLGSGFNAFVSANAEALDRDGSRLEEGYDSYLLGATVGGDYAVTDWATAGAALNYNYNNGDFDSDGGFTFHSVGGILFGAFTPFPGFFTDVSLGYAYKHYNVERFVRAIALGPTDELTGATAESDSHSNNFDARLAAGYDHHMDNITVGPRAGLRYGYTAIGAFSETGDSGLELAYEDQGVTSLQTSLGAQASIAISTRFGVLVPQANVNWIHEFRDDQRFTTVRLVDDVNDTPFFAPTAKPDRDFFDVGVGIVAVLPHGLQPFARFRAVLGHESFDNYGGAIGVRAEF